jgi:SSS family transporter
MPEFLEKRFSPSARALLSGISLIAYILTKIAVGIFAGGIVFSVLLPDLNVLGLNSFWVGSILVILFTGAYTVLGGLRAVAYTEALQTVVLVVGSLFVLIYGLEAIGGWNRLYEIAGEDMFDLWKPLVPAGMESTWAPVLEEERMAWYFNSNYPWLGMLFAAPVVGLWYWTTDQYIVQRALGAENVQEARRGSIAAAFLKLLPVFIFIIPGIITFALAKSGEITALQQALIDERGEVITQNAQAAFPMLVTHVLPVGVRGIVVAGLLAALMSSLAGVFHASSTLFTMDLYHKIKPAATDCAFRLGGWQRPRSGANESAAVFALYVFPMAEAKADAFHAYFEDVLEPLLIRAGAPVGALFVTEPSENTYPRLPVRAGARVCVWLARFVDRGEHDAFSARLRGSSGWQDVLSTGFAEHLNGPLCTSRLSPTARSLLR